MTWTILHNLLKCVLLRLMTLQLGLNASFLIHVLLDRSGSTRILLLDANDVIIADIPVPGRPGAKEFTFIGAVFESPLIAKVQIFSGDAALDATRQDLSAGGTRDLVVMDDFIYGEPQPVQ